MVIGWVLVAHFARKTWCVAFCNLPKGSPFVGGVTAYWAVVIVDIAVVEHLASISMLNVIVCTLPLTVEVPAAIVVRSIAESLRPNDSLALSWMTLIAVVTESVITAVVGVFTAIEFRADIVPVFGIVVGNHRIETPWFEVFEQRASTWLR